MNSFSLAAEVRGLIRAPSPDAVLLTRASELFDQLCAETWSGGDPLGERCEIALSLAFVAWRHSTALGLESESQEWLRVTDQLLPESCAWVDSLSDRLSTDEFCFVGSDGSPIEDTLDAFVALSVLRRDQHRRLAQTRRAAAGLYRRLRQAGRSDPEWHFLIGECSYLSASMARSVGKGRESLNWTREARREFRKTHANRPLRAKILAVRQISNRDRHRHSSFERRFAKVRAYLREFGHYHEDIGCRLANALVYKELGQTQLASQLLNEMIEELQHSSEGAYLVACLANLAELSFASGDVRTGKSALAEATRVAESYGSALALANLFVAAGACHEQAGEVSLSEEMYRRSMACFAEAGADSWVAYLRVLVAELLVAAGRSGEARNELLLAMPVLWDENMVPEGIHAIQLLSRITAAPRDSADRLLEMKRRLGI